MSKTDRNIRRRASRRVRPSYHRIAAGNLVREDGFQLSIQKASVLDKKALRDSFMPKPPYEYLEVI